MSAAAAKLIGVDIGAESGRVMVGHLDGDHLKLEELRRFSTGAVRVGEGLFTDVLHIWGEIQSGLAQAAARYGDQIASVGVDTWGVDCALLDANGSLLSNPRHYRDPRTQGMLEKAFARVPREEIYHQTGNQFEVFNTLYQLLATAEYEPDLLSAAHSLLMLPDLFHYWLSGERACEYTDATTTQCYNQRAQDWAWDLLEKFSLPARLFGPIAQPGSSLGGLVPYLAESTGCAKNVRVILPASHDTGSAVTAIPVTEPDFLYISSGTWSLVGVELAQPVITPASLALNFTNEGSPQGRIRFLRNVPGMWLLQQCRQAWAQQGRSYTYGELTELAEAVPADGALIDVADASFRSPGDMPARIRTYCRNTGQPQPESEGAVTRRLLESLACQYRALLEEFERLLGRPMRTIHIIGGGARNRLLNQMTADCTSRRVVAGPYEATAAGNVLVQAMGLGYLHTVEDIRRVVRHSFEPESYHPVPSVYWEDCYQRYRKLVG